MRRQKFGNELTTINGIKFASRLEAERFQQLLWLEKAGEIAGLRRQVEFQVFKGYRNDQDEKTKSTFYVADFMYIDVASHKMVVEDTKGMETPEFRLKWKLAQSQYPEYEFRKVTRDMV